MRTVFLLTALFWILPPAALADDPDVAMADALLDIARSTALNRAGRQTEQDIVQIRALLRGVQRLDPASTEASKLLYELASLGGDEAARQAALDEMLRRNPLDEALFAIEIDNRLRQAQTVEAQRDWLKANLGPPRTPTQIAMAQARLGMLAARGLDPRGAREWLDNARASCPDCPEVIALELTLATSDAPLAEQVHARLRAVERSPLNPTLSWLAGELLHENGFAHQGGVLLDHALRLHERLGTKDGLTARMHMLLSENYLLRETGNPLAEAQKAVLTREGSYEPAFYSLWFSSLFLGPNVATEIRNSLATQFNAISDPEKAPLDTVIYASWFYTLFERRAERALKFAEAAIRRAPDDLVARRVYGWALASNDRTDEAKKVLSELAPTDAYAAFRLAKIYSDAGDVDSAVDVIMSTRRIPAAGFVRALVNGLQLPLPEASSQPASQKYPEALAEWDAFNQNVLDYDLTPAHFLAAEVRPAQVNYHVGEPWQVDFSLTNRADFTISLGPDGMTNPTFLLSFTVQGASAREYPALFTVSLDQHRWLSPGQTIRVRRNVELGPLRAINRSTPQQLQTVTIRAILDPVRMRDGRWAPALGGQELPPINFSRVPAAAGAALVHAQFSALSDPEPALRSRALDVLAQLLGETQRRQAGKVKYAMTPAPTEAIIPALASALGSADWRLRAQTLDALQTAGLDARLVDAALACLDHSHWLVRMMAIRLLSRQPELIREPLERMTSHDPDELVRAYAAAAGSRMTKGDTTDGE